MQIAPQERNHKSRFRNEPERLSRGTGFGDMIDVVPQNINVCRWGRASKMPPMTSILFFGHSDFVFLCDSSEWVKLVHSRPVTVSVAHHPPMYVPYVPPTNASPPAQYIHTYGTGYRMYIIPTVFICMFPPLHDHLPSIRMYICISSSFHLYSILLYPSSTEYRYRSQSGGTCDG